MKTQLPSRAFLKTQETPIEENLGPYLGRRVDHSSCCSAEGSHLFGFLFTDLSWNLTAGLAGNLLTLLLGFLSRHVFALLSGNLVANLSGNLPALFSLHLVAHFLRNFTARRSGPLDQRKVKIRNISYSQTSLATCSHSCLVTGSHWVLVTWRQSSLAEHS